MGRVLVGHLHDPLTGTWGHYQGGPSATHSPQRRLPPFRPVDKIFSVSSMQHSIDFPAAQRKVEGKGECACVCVCASVWISGVGAGSKSRVGPARGGGGKQGLREARAWLRSQLTCRSPSCSLRAPAPTHPVPFLLPPSPSFPFSPPSLAGPSTYPPHHFPSDQRTNEEDVPANWGSNFPQLVSGLREQERADPPRSAAHGGGGGGAVMG